MKVLGPIAIIALLLLLVVATTTNAKLLFSWRKYEGDLVKDQKLSSSSSMKNIRLHLPLRNENLLDEPDRKGFAHTTEELETLARIHQQQTSSSASSPLFDHDKFDKEVASSLSNKNMKQADHPAQKEITRRLALWRRILSPSAEHETLAQQTLASLNLDKKCERKAFDYFECAELSREIVESAFDVELEYMQEVLNPKANMIRLSAKAESKKSLPGIAFVSNLQVGADEVQPYRFGAMEKKEQEEGEKQKQKQQSQGKKAASNTRNAEQLSSSVKTPPFGSDGNAPHVLATQFSVSFLAPSDRPTTRVTSLKLVQTDLYCKSGNFPNQNSDPISCGSGDSAPQSLSIRVVSAVDSTPLCEYTIVSLYDACSLYNYDTQSVLCKFQSFNLDDAQQQPTGCNSNYPIWTPVVLQARTNFADGSSSAWTSSRTWSYGAFEQTSGITSYPTSDSFKIDGNRPQFNPKYLTFSPTTAATLFPQDLRKIYNLPDISTTTAYSANYPTNPASSIGIFELGSPQLYSSGKGFSKNDLTLYMQQTNTPFDVNLVSYIGLDAEDAVGTESELDIELIASLTRNTPIYFYTKDASGVTNAPDIFERWLSDLANDKLDYGYNPTAPRPTVWSVSYGVPDSNQAGVLSSAALAAVQRSGTKMQMLASAGITLVVASGDAGASCSKTSDVFGASFPSTCPQAISVGAVSQRISTTTGMLRHEVTNAAYGDLITSGGGISGTFPVPSYQSTSIKSSSSNNLFAYSGAGERRATPDVSAIGANLYIVNQGNDGSVSGTSASAPIFASLMSYWNNMRMATANNRTSMTNAAAWIWNNNFNNNNGGGGTKTSLFTDIPEGRGDNCFAEQQGAPGNIPVSSRCWKTLNGWDAVTGWGEPLGFSSLLSSFKSFNPPPVPIQQFYHPSSSPNILLIVGATAGGIAFIAIVATIVYYLRKRNAAANSGTQNILHNTQFAANVNAGQEYGQYRQQSSV